MQYKNLGASINAISDLEKMISTLSSIEEGYAQTKKEIQMLDSISSKYSTEVLKLASAHVTLTEQQAITLFTSKGLKAAELEQAVATATLSASEAAATGTTVGLGAAFQGLAEYSNASEPPFYRLRAI